MKNPCPLWDSNPGPSAYEAKAQPRLRGLISVDGIKVHLVLTVLLLAFGRCSKINCGELHFVNSLKSANLLIVQTAKRYKNTRQIVLLHLPHAIGI